MPGAGLRIVLFGPPAATAGKQARALPAAARTRALLAYLLLRGAQAAQREVLIDTFWPDEPPERARRALRQALWQIRRALPGLIEAEGSDVALNLRANVWVDVLEFQALAGTHLDAPRTSEALQGLRAALALCRGEFLEGCYDEWSVRMRRRLAERAEFVAERLLALEKAGGNYAGALELARRLLAADPLRESAHREVMRLHVLLERPDAALQQFEQCREILARELGVEPERETAALAREIAARAAAPPQATRPAPAADPPLVGRAPERAALVELIEAAFNGAGGLVLVEGEAGIGKTRLLEEIARDAEWRGAQVAWGRTPDSAMALPYGPLAAALDAGLSPLRAGQIAQLVEPIWLQALAAIVPALRERLPSLSAPPALDPQEERVRLFEALPRVLAAWGRVIPLVLVLEDLHWAGADTWQVLETLAARLRGTTVLLIGSCRGEDLRADGALWSRVQALDRAGLRARLALGGLDPEGVAELARALLRRVEVSAQLLARLQAEAGGNPLFLLEMVESLRDKDRAEPGIAARGSLPLPRGVERAIARRLTLLPASRLAVLQVAAVLGSECEMEHLRATGGWESAALLDALRDLVQRRFLRELRDGYRFYHEQIRRVVYAALPARERVRLHREAARVLASARPAAVEQLALHCTAGEWWDQAVIYHFDAAERARRMYAAQSALEHYDRVLETLDRHAPFDARQCDEWRYAARAARHELRTARGDIAEAADDLDALDALAEALGDPARRCDALNRRALFLITYRDEYGAARDAATRARDLARAHDLQREAAQAAEYLGQAYQWSNDFPRAQEALREALAIWQTLPDAVEYQHRVHIHLAQICQRIGALDQAEAEIQAALALAEERQDSLLLALTYGVLGMVTAARGDPRTAIGYFQICSQHLQVTGVRRNEATMLINLAFAYLALRDHGHAIAALEEALTIHRQLGNRRGCAAALNNLGVAYRETGRFAQARAVLDECLVLVREIKHVYLEILTLCARARLDLDQGHLDLAQDALAQAQACAAAAVPHARAWLLFTQALLAHAAGHTSAAAAGSEQAAELFAACGAPASANVCRSYLALYRCDLGDAPAALELTRAVLAEVKAHSYAEEIPAVYLNHAYVLHAAGHVGEALAALDAAQASLDDQRASLADPAWQRDFDERVPLVRAVAAARAAWQIAPVTVRLPRAGVPSGRPLRTDEWVEVRWHLALPDEAAATDKAALRRQRVVRLAREATEQGALPTVEDLAHALGVNVKTIKRDLAALRAAGQTVRTRGTR
jgi:DNA-binding SARP family transcriptional activator/tetratricopeptide (TPR) repeat protein